MPVRIFLYVFKGLGDTCDRFVTVKYKMQGNAYRTSVVLGLY